MVGVFKAELLKIKSSSFFWILILFGIGLSVFTLLMYLLGPEAYVSIGENPWGAYLNQNLNYFSLIVYPLAIIVVSSMVINLEHKSDSWKMLLTLPNLRWQIFTGKLLIILFLSLTISVLFQASIFLFSIPINWIHPEVEFFYYEPEVGNFLLENLKLVISCLAIIGFQFFLSLLFKNQIIPVAIGMILLISGFLLGMTSPNLAINFPYSYSMMYKNFGMSSYFDTQSIVGIPWKSTCMFLIISIGSYLLFISKK